MEPVLKAAFPSILRCAFEPKHANNLSNEFRCFATYAGGLGVAEEGEAGAGAPEPSA